MGSQSDYSARLDGPVGSAAVVTPSDSTVFTTFTRCLYIGGTGDVKVRMLDQTDVTFASVPAGFLLPVVCDKIYSTGTTATLIVRMT